MGLLNHASDYKKEFPDQEFIGISINGDGEGKAMDYDQFIKEFTPSEFEMVKLSQVEGQQINAIIKLTAAVSADLVTEPGARGRVLLESKKIKTIKRRTKMIEAMKKFLFGAEKQDLKLMEEAAKAMLQSEGGEDDEAKKKEAAAEEAETKQAEGVAKALLAVKKETKKFEGEAESEYEARCMKQAMKQMKKEAADAEEAAKAEAAKKEEFPPKKDDKKDGEPDGDEKEKKEAADKAAAEAAAKDKDPMAEMKKENEELKKEIAALKKEKKESEDESKKHHEESAKAKIELETKKRTEGVDKILRESGLPRYATDNLRDLLITKVRSEGEMKKIVEAAKEVHSKAIESAFYSATSTGLTEMQPTEAPASNDHLF